METAQKILNSAEALIQKHGFSGFSFQDIADEIGIRKASIHYHYPAKADLGRAVIQRYRTRMAEVGNSLDLKEDGLNHWQALALYLEPIVQLGRTPGHACLCGVLGGEYLSLPDAMQAEIAGYFDEQITWLTDLLDSGRAAGAFRFHGSAGEMARLLFGAIEGGLLIKRTTGDIEFIDRILTTAQALLGGEP